VAPLLLAAAGVVALGIAIAILRSFGPGYRVGRLLAVVPQVSIADAVRLAHSGERRYVRVDGRIDSEAEFEDENHRPLVVRRTRIEWQPEAGGAEGRGPIAWRGGAGWRGIGEPQLELAAFVVREGLDEIDVDAAGLGDGLVVVPRVSTGSVADLGERAPAGAPPTAAARMVVQQVSSVEHATVLGVPVVAVDGRAVIGPGLGRPLILTTLERDEAMRVLTGGAAGRSRLAIASLVAGIALVAAAVLWWLADALIGGAVATVLAASPDPTMRPGTDIRGGSEPGFVGEPLLAILGVVGVGLASLGATLAWVRLTGGRRRPSR
jgi:hypothetical protein